MQPPKAETKNDFSWEIALSDVYKHVKIQKAKVLNIGLICKIYETFACAICN